MRAFVSITIFAFLFLVVCQTKAWALTDKDREDVFNRAVGATGSEYLKYKEELMQEKPEVLRPFLEGKLKDADWNVRMTSRFLLFSLEWPGLLESFMKCKPLVDHAGMPRYSSRRDPLPDVKKALWIIEVLAKDLIVEESNLYPEIIARRPKWAFVKTLFLYLFPAMNEVLQKDLALAVVQGDDLKLCVLEAISFFGDSGTVFFHCSYVRPAKRISKEKMRAACEVLLEGLTIEAATQLRAKSRDESETYLLEVTLYLLGDEKAPKRWLKMLPEVTSGRVKKRYVGLLGKYGSADMLPTLEKMLKEVPEGGSLQNIQLWNTYEWAVEEIRSRSEPKDGDEDLSDAEGANNEHEQELTGEPSKSIPPTIPWYVIILICLALGGIAVGLCLALARRRGKRKP